MKYYRIINKNQLSTHEKNVLILIVHCKVKEVGLKVTFRDGKKNHFRRKREGLIDKTLGDF